MILRFRKFRQNAIFIIAGVMFSFNVSSSVFRDSRVNTPGSVRASTLAGMQWESFLIRKTGRQWAQKVIAYPMDRPVNDVGPIETGFRLVFSVLVPTDWVVTDKLTMIHVLHPSIGGSNTYRIYIKGNQYYFLSAGHEYFAPIKFGMEQTFYVNCRMAYADSDEPGWVEVFIDQIPTGSSNPLPGQFVPRHKVSIQDGDVNPYLEIGLDTGRQGMPENVAYRRLFWSLKEILY